MCNVHQDKIRVFDILSAHNPKIKLVFRYIAARARAHAVLAPLQASRRGQFVWCGARGILTGRCRPTAQCTVLSAGRYYLLHSMYKVDKRYFAINSTQFHTLVKVRLLIACLWPAAASPLDPRAPACGWLRCPCVHAMCRVSGCYR